VEFLLIFAGFHLAINLEWLVAAAREDFPQRAGRLAVRIGGVLFRLALLSAVAAVIVWLTDIFGASVRLPLPYQDWQKELLRRPATPTCCSFPP